MDLSAIIFRAFFGQPAKQLSGGPGPTFGVHWAPNASQKEAKLGKIWVQNGPKIGPADLEFDMAFIDRNQFQGVLGEFFCKPSPEPSREGPRAALGQTLTHFGAFWVPAGGPIGNNFLTFWMYFPSPVFESFFRSILGGVGGRGGAPGTFRICRIRTYICKRPALPSGGGEFKGFAPAAGPP